MLYIYLPVIFAVYEIANSIDYTGYITSINTQAHNRIRRSDAFIELLEVAYLVYLCTTPLFVFAIMLIVADFCWVYAGHNHTALISIPATGLGAERQFVLSKTGFFLRNATSASVMMSLYFYLA